MSRRKGMLRGGFAGVHDEKHTAFAGAGLLIEACRQVDIGERAEKVSPRKHSAKCLSAGQMVECFVVGSVLGMECLEDMERLRLAILPT